MLALTLMELAGKANKAITEAHGEAERRFKSGVPFTSDELAPLIERAIGTWDPKVKGISVLTPKLRNRVSKTFAMLAYNLAAASAGKQPE